MTAVKALSLLPVAAVVSYFAYALGAGYIQVFPKPLNQLLALVVVVLFVWVAVRTVRGK